jgi:outer membrane receptor for ferrienterochelin and colicins
VELKNIPDGQHTLTFSSIGYPNKEISYFFPLVDFRTQEVTLQQDIEELEEILVTTTRTNSRIEETPLKIEVLELEEMNEESSFVPGNITSILGDISSVQIQQTSPVSGNSVVRMQGLNGRYTLLLRDGIPSYGDLSGGLNILQISPLDLQQIEIVKGPASTQQL